MWDFCEVDADQALGVALSLTSRSFAAHCPMMDVSTDAIVTLPLQQDRVRKGSGHLNALLLTRSITKTSYPYTSGKNRSRVCRASCVVSLVLCVYAVPAASEEAEGP